MPLERSDCSTRQLAPEDARYKKRSMSEKFEVQGMGGIPLPA